MKEDKNEEYYKALEQVKFEGQLLWQVFGSFLLALTIIIVFLLDTVFGNN